MRFFIALFLFLPSLPLFSAQFYYSYMPKTLYETQRFSITIAFESPHRTLESPPRFELQGGPTPINNDPIHTFHKTTHFFTFYFYAPKDQSELTTPAFSIYFEGNRFRLKSHTITIKKLPFAPPNFANVLANTLKIKSMQIANFDEHHNIITALLEATHSTLENFSIKGIKEQGVEIKQDNGLKQLAEYFAVIPRGQKELTFSYFNLLQKMFHTLKIESAKAKDMSIDISELTPTQDPYLKFKRYASLGIGALMALMFLYRREILFLLLALLFLGAGYYFFISKQSRCVKQGAPIHLIPTPKSNISRYLSKETVAPVVGERGEYLKILLEGKFPGWVKKEDLCNE